MSSLLAWLTGLPSPIIANKDYTTILYYTILKTLTIVIQTGNARGQGL